MEQLVELFASLVRAHSGARTSFFMSRFEAPQNLSTGKVIAIRREKGCTYEPTWSQDQVLPIRLFPQGHRDLRDETRSRAQKYGGKRPCWAGCGPEATAP